MAGLFDTFTVAKRGLNVQQGNINTTSHNIANANTTGYSRQRATVETTRPFGGLSKYDSCSYGQVGTGAQITTIARIRDKFLDYQVRTETTNNGTFEVKNQYLYQVEDILNETSSTGIQGALSDYYNAFQELSKAPEKESNRTTALQKASALADLLNSRATQLENKKSDAQKELSQYVSSINDMLDQVNELNKQISRVSAVGMTPNDLMDSRDNLLDQLSEKFGIKVTEQDRNTIDLSLSENTKNSVGTLVNSNPNDTGYTRFSYVQDAVISKDGKTLTVTYNALGNTSSPKEINITDGDLKSLQKQLLEGRILIAGKDGSVDASDNASLTKKVLNNSNTGIEKGQIAGNQSVQKDIQKYMDDLDIFAAAFAYSVNAIQTGDDGNGSKGILVSEGTYKTDSALIFVNKDKVDSTGTTKPTDTGITAKNISINSAVQKNVSLLNCGEKYVDDYSGEKDGSRALAMADIKNLKIDFTQLTNLNSVATRSDYFTNAGLTFSDSKKNVELSNKKTTGSKLNEVYNSMVSKLATKSSSASDNASAQKIVLAALTNQRTSVSGVSLDEEMADLIQFQHSYQANAKMISTVDELLDVVINGLKR